MNELLALACCVAGSLITGGIIAVNCGRKGW